MGNKTWLFKLGKAGDRKDDIGKALLSFQGDENALKLTGAMATHTCVYTKPHWTCTF